MLNLAQDLQYGYRVAVRSLGITAAAVLTLALGIGSVSAMFSVVNGVLLRPLLYAEPDRLVMVWEIYPPEGIDYLPASAPDYMDWRAQSQSFDSLAAMVETNFNLTEGGDPERARGGRVTASLFPLLGIEPALGRTFLLDEEEPGRHRVVVLSHALWQRRFGSDPGVVGKTMLIDGAAHTVVGIMPRGFEFPPPFSRDGAVYATRHELWVPLVLTPEQLNQRLAHFLRVLGRLKPDVTLAQARAEMDRIVRQVSRDYPDEHADIEAHVVGLHDQVVGFVRPAILLLMVAVGLVLAIACANVANLLFARGAARQREIAIRFALGARRRRVFRQLLTESVMLSVLGGAMGLVLAYLGMRLLNAYIPGSVPRLAEVGLDFSLVGPTLAVSVLTGIAFGMAPAWRVRRIDLHGSLKEGGRTTTAGSSQRRLRSSLVVLEIALSLTLLIGASVLIQSFIRLRRVDPGFLPQNVLVWDLTLPESKYPEEHQKAAFYHQAVQRLRNVGGVVSAGAISHLPLGGTAYGNLARIEGRAMTSLKDVPTTTCGAVTPGYFRTMGIPLIRGRTFTDLDTIESNLVVVINQTMARRFWPDTEPIGKRFKQGQPGQEAPWLAIVGVVGDVKQWGLTAEIRPAVYLPRLQDPFRTNRGADPGSMSLVMRSESQPENLVPTVREALGDLDREVILSNLRTLEQVVSGSTASRRFTMLLMGLFAAMALALAVMGIFSVITFSVAERTHEMGVRMAFGAGARDVVSLVVRTAMKLTLTGVTLGLAGGFALTRLMSGLLYGVRGIDLLSFVGAPILFFAISIVASTIPARSATAADPLVALRYE